MGSILFAACTAERMFRVDRAQEHLHYVVDIALDVLYILDEGAITVSTTGSIPHTPDDETALPSPTSNHGTPPSYVIPEMKVK